MSARRTRALAAGLAMLTLAPATAAAAAPSVVVDAASRGGRCSDARSPERVSVKRPWCTLAHALRRAPGGRTVLVRGGSYPATAVADTDPGRTVTVGPFGRERPVVAGVTVDRSAHLRLRGLRLTTGVVVRDSHDIDVTGNEMALTPAGPFTESGVILDEVRHVRVRGNWIHDGRDGVNVLGTVPESSDVVIAGNHFERLGNDGVHVSLGTDIVIVGNRIDDVRVRPDVDPEAHSDGMQIMGPTRDVVVWGNRVAGGRGFLLMVSPRREGLAGQGHQGLVVADNVLLGPDFGIRTFSTPGARIVNNTVWGTSRSPYSGLDVRDRAGEANDESGGMVVANNVVKQLDVDPAVGFAVQAGNLIASGPRAAGDLPGLPSFVAPAAGDLRLAPGSPGLDGADPALAPPLDAEGRPRAVRPDVGAYERGGRPSGAARLMRAVVAFARR